MTDAKSHNKKIVFKPKPRPTAKLESWIEGGGDEIGTKSVVAESEPLEPLKRFTIDVSESLHARVKSQCALRKKKMADVIREFLEREFPEA